MRILIDYTQIPIQRVGVGYYAFNLLKEIELSDTNYEIFVVIQDDDVEAETLFSNKGLNVIKIKSAKYRKFRNRFLFEQFGIPKLCRKYKIDLLHSLHYSFPIFLSRTKRVVTIHDLTYYKTPEYHEKVKNYYFRFFIRMASRYANMLICVSDSTKNDLIEITSVNSKKCKTIHLGKDIGYEDFCFMPSVKENLIKKFDLSGRYILFIGTIEPRKNVISIVKAFKELLLDFPDLKLVIVGKQGWGATGVNEFIVTNNLESKVVFTGYVTDEEKLHLLKGTEVFVYPSNYEGFGIPVLEAMALGVPTITSNISSLPEVAGDGALQVSPNSIEEILKALKLLLDNEEVKIELINKAKNQSKRFSWEKMMNETLMTYGDV